MRCKLFAQPWQYSVYIQKNKTEKSYCGVKVNYHVKKIFQLLSATFLQDEYNPEIVRTDRILLIITKNSLLCFLRYRLILD